MAKPEISKQDAAIGVKVQGKCPLCKTESLFLGKSGYVTCKDPGAASDILRELAGSATGSAEKIAEAIRDAFEIEDSGIVCSDEEMASVIRPLLSPAAYPADPQDGINHHLDALSALELEKRLDEQPEPADLEGLAKALVDTLLPDEEGEPYLDAIGEVLSVLQANQPAVMPDRLLRAALGRLRYEADSEHADHRVVAAAKEVVQHLPVDPCPIQWPTVSEVKAPLEAEIERLKQVNREFNQMAGSSQEAAADLRAQLRTQERRAIEQVIGDAEAREAAVYAVARWYGQRCGGESIEDRIIGAYHLGKIFPALDDSVVGQVAAEMSDEDIERERAAFEEVKGPEVTASTSARASTRGGRNQEKRHERHHPRASVPGAGDEARAVDHGCASPVGHSGLAGDRGLGK